MKLLVYLVVCCALVTVLGCGGSTSVTPAITAGKIYVTNGSSTSILRFNAGMSGNVVPQNSISATVVSPIFLAIDIPHDRLVSLGFGTGAFAVIDNASTNLGPIRTISGPSTTLFVEPAIAIDGTTDLIYVLDTNNATGARSVKVFGPASTIDGDVAPLRVINIPLAAGGTPGMLVDSANDRLFVSDCIGNAIEVFDHVSTLSGTVTPNRIISGPATQLNFPDPMALDRSGNLVVASDAGPATVLVFANAAAASGNLAPTNAAGIDVNGAIQIAVSPADELFVVDGSAVLNIYKDISTSSGNLVPARTIAGPQTGLDTDPKSGLITPVVFGLALDPTRP